MATDAFRTHFLSASCCSYYCSLVVLVLILVLPQNQAFLIPAVNAFTTAPTFQIKHSLALAFALREECHRANDGRRFALSGETLFIKQQRGRQGKLRRTLLPLEATTKQTSQDERNVDVAEERTTAAVTSIQTEFENKWLQQFDNLKAFRGEHGHCKVPISQGSLGRWVRTQRSFFKQGKLRKDRKALLDKIGFVWDAKKDSWQSNYDSLKAYKKKSGHCNVPSAEGSLGRWVDKQRVNFKAGRMPKDRINLLEKVGFVWDPLDDMWHNKYKDLAEFQLFHGHVNVPAGYPLSDWTIKERLNYAAGRLDVNKKALLDALGFVWEDPDFERHERQWNEMFSELEQYKSRHGHVRVPVQSSSLGQWVMTQRKLYRDGKLLEHREAKLESIGFIWRLKEYTERDTTTRDKKWMKKYEELVEFQEEHGHTNVLARGGPLWRWVDSQRVALRNDKMRDDRKELLDEIGFEFEPMKATSGEKWQARYKELRSYKKEVGDLLVSGTKNPRLYKWIYQQRKYQKAGRLESKRKAMLDKLGMEW